MTLRFAVACPAGMVQAWQQRCVDRLITCASAVWIAMIDAGDASTPSPPGPALFDVPAMRVQALDSRGANTQRCNASDRSGVLALNLDFVLCFDNGASASLASIARYGSWEFRFGGDAGANEPPCFWECFDARAVAQLALLRNAGDDGVRVMRAGAIGIDPTSLHASIGRALDAAALWPSAVCRAIAAGAILDEGPAAVPVAARPRHANAAASLLLSLKIAARRIARVVDMLF